VDRLFLVVAEHASGSIFKGEALAIVRGKMTAIVNSSQKSPRIAGDAVSESAIYFEEKVRHR
jgi:hypothetical protein